MPFTPPRGPVSLPNALIDTSPVNQGLTNLGNALAERRKRLTVQEIGRAAQSGDLGAASQAAYGAGELGLGLQFGNVLAQRNARSAAAARQQAQDAESKRRWDLTHGLSQDRLSLDRDRFGLDERYRKAQIEKLEREQTQRANVGPFKDLKEKSQVEMGLRKEFSQLTKTFRDVRDAYGRVQSTDENGAGDIALIFNYMKMLDPGSVVREGEFATAETAGGVGPKVWNLYNRLLFGERLDDTLRSDFKNQAKRLYDRSNQQFQVLRNRYGDIAKTYQLDPSMTAQDFSQSVLMPAGVTVKRTK